MKRILAFLSVLLFFSLLLFFPQQFLAGAKAGLMCSVLYASSFHASSYSVLSDFTYGTFRPSAHKRRAYLAQAPSAFSPRRLRLFYGNSLRLSHGCQNHGRPVPKRLCFQTGGQTLILLTFSNYPGPAFLLTYLCVGILQREDLAFFSPA